MVSFWRNAGGKRAEFRCRLQGRVVRLELVEGENKVPVSRWAQKSPHAKVALDRLFSTFENAPSEGNFAVTAAHLDIPVEGFATLDAAVAAALELPVPSRLALDLRPKGGIQDPDFHIVARWVRPGGSAERTEVYGAILKTAAGLHSIPDPLYSLWRAAQALAKPIGEEGERYRAVAALKAVWPDGSDLPVESDRYLSDLRLFYGAAMSVKLTVLTPNRTDFEPVLFGAPAVAEAEEESRILDEDLDNLLPKAAQHTFAKERFYSSDGRKAAYVLRKGEYVYIDPAIRPVLGEIRRLQGASEAERREFILNPVVTLKRTLGAEVADRIGLENLFIETEQFSERVAGVDVWRKPITPWITPAQKNSWIPERFGVRIGEDFYTIDPPKAAQLIHRVDIAEAAGASLINVGDLLEPAAADGSPAPETLPLSEGVIWAAQSLRPFAWKGHGGNADGVSEGAPPLWDAASQGKLFLVVRDNFDEVEFASPLEGGIVPDADLPIIAPTILKTRLKQHQREGFEWLAKSVRAGRPGTLLADDMGLGKTLQAITFMTWLRAEADEGRRAPEPFLIIAPTGLLGNWQAEIDKHLDEPGLGPLARVFGGDLKRLREESGLTAPDIETGRAALDSGAWRQAGIVLTTYETLRDYHFSFARTRFGLVVYDEIQKLKNPASQMSRAARTLNASFVLGMTGTPIENRLQDLWSIMDVIAPGLLGSSRDFERRYPSTDREALAALKAKLLDRSTQGPPFMMRRLKSDALEGLPRKLVTTYPVSMPPVQADTYRNVVMDAAAASSAGKLGKGGMLTYLASMRGVSLHPQDPRKSVDELERYALESARLTCALEILDKAQARSEKALVFVEDRAMQERFARLVQERYRLRSRPILINGDVPGPVRQSLVDAFQRAPGQFDVMILSPKAGGVGLTITAANHVIHLSRWWNPAVEDQATDRVFRIGQTKDVYVHIPLAVHPDPALKESSFDLRLDALIERKRQLTRDLFLPPEASDADLAKLFEDVSLGGNAVGEEGAAQSWAASMVPGQEIASEGQPPLSRQEAPRRRVLSLSNPSQPTGVLFWMAEPHQPRPTSEIFELFRGKKIRHVTISDPYALASASARQAQIRFLDDLVAVAEVKAVTIEYAPDVDHGDDSSWRRDLGTLFGSSDAQKKGATLTPRRREKRGRNDDFHDRNVTFDVEHAGGAMRQHRLHIGRGLEALYDDHRQCTVTYAPPS